VVGNLSSSPVKELPLFPPRLFSPPDQALEAFRFRLAAEDDLTSLYTLFYSERRYLEFRAYFQGQLERQRQGRSCWLLTEQATLIIGTGQFISYPHGAELANLNVAHDYQSRGIGSAMIQILMRLARHVGQSELEIGVSVENQRALNLYRRLGFVEDRILRQYETVPAIILRKQI